MIQDESISTLTVPWTTRDVWQGIVFESLLLISVILFLIWSKHEGIYMDPGVIIISTEPLVLLPVWIWAVRKYKAGWGSLGFRRFPRKTIGLGCGLILLTYFFNVIYGSLLSFFHLRTQADLIVPLIKSSSFGWIWIGAVVVAPFVEEVFFRGFIFAGLRGPYGWQKAAIISSLIFAVAHMQLTAMLPLFILGYIFAYLYEKSRSIWPAIFMHLTVNGLSLGAIYLFKMMKT
jgi:hypothetical protein